MTFNYSHVQIIIILISLILGYVVWTYNSKSYLNKILTLIIICILLIEMSHFFYLRREETPYLHATIILGSLGISFFSPFFYILSLYYPIKKNFKMRDLIVVYSLALVFSLFIIVSFPKSYMINQVQLPINLKDISLKELPLLFVLLYFLLTSFSLILLILATRNLFFCFQSKLIPYEKRTVLLLIIVGVPFAFLLSVVSVINYFFSIPFPWIEFFFGAFTLFIVVLIFRFHLIDFKRFIFGLIFYPSLIAILVFIYITLIVKNQHKIAQILMLKGSVVFILEVFIIYMIITTITRLLRNYLARRKVFLTSLSSVGNIESLEYLSYATTLKDLARRLVETFRKHSKIETLYLLHLNGESDLLTSVNSSSQPLEISVNDEIITALTKLNRGVTLEELLIHLNSRDSIKKLYNMGVNLILPIAREKEIIALLLLPMPGFLQRWSYDDINALNFLKIAIPSLIGRCVMYENERELEKHQYRMEQLMVMGEMASGIAHEIRNPLSIIATSVETIVKGDVSEDEKRLMLQYIQEETNRINILANKLLGINFVRNPNFSSVDLGQIIVKLKNFLAYKLKDSNIQLVIHKGKEIVLYSDADTLFQIFLNLVLNAIEALKKSGRIAIDYIKKSSVVEIFVSDNGPGIPPSLRNKIFEPFFTTKKKGSGLGLTVTKKLVESLFGTIELTNAEGGACFKLSLPLLPKSE